MAMLTCSSSSSLLLPTCLLILIATVSAQQTNQIRTTTSGDIRGFVKNIEGRGDVEHYLGIPFAEPPVGKLRFAKPVPVKAWNGVKETQKHSKACLQYLPTSIDLRDPAAAVWLNNTEMSEDCLYLNVWVPKPMKKKRAMLVWIYGGGFCGGSANLDIYNGAILAATNDIVVASMQYRVGAFGFLSVRAFGSDGVETANAGLWDQNMAMAWLKRNAESFGADPARITLKGESAGAVSVSMHLLSPHSHSLFSRAILHSGSFLGPWALLSPERAHRRAVNLAVAVGCVSVSRRKEMYNADKEKVQQLLACLRRVDAQRFVDKLGDANYGESNMRQKAIYDRGFRGRVPDNANLPFDMLLVISLVPVLERGFFPLTPDEAYQRGLMKKAPLLLGVNKNEGSYFLFYYMPPFSKFVANPKTQAFANVTEKVLTRDPADYIADYILPLNYLYPEVLDEILLTYTVPSRRLFPFLLEKANKTHWSSVLDDITGDMNFKCCVLTLGDWYAEQGNDVYVYNFEHRTKSNTFPTWTGAMHGYELEYTFGTPLSSQFTRRHYKFTNAEKRLSENMMERWSNFVKMGNPNLNEDGRQTDLQPKWPRYTMRREDLLRFQTSGSREKVTLGTNLRRRYCQMWMKLVPNLSARLENITCSTSVNKVSALIPYPIWTTLSVLAVWISTSWRTVLTFAP